MTEGVSTAVVEGFLELMEWAVLVTGSTSECRWKFIPASGVCKFIFISVLSVALVDGFLLSNFVAVRH